MADSASSVVPTRFWPDLSAERAGLWMTPDAFVLLFVDGADRDAALQRLQEQSRLRGGFPANLALFDHGAWPGLRMDRELRATPLAISAAFPSSTKLPIGDYAAVALLEPSRILLPAPLLRVAQSAENPPSRLLRQEGRPAKPLRVADPLAWVGLRVEEVWLRPSAPTQDQVALVPQRDLSMLGFLSGAPGHAWQILACRTQALPALRMATGEEWPVVAQADQQVALHLRKEAISRDLDALIAPSNGQGEALFLNDATNALRRLESAMERRERILQEQPKEKNRVTRDLTQPSGEEDWFEETDQQVITLLRRAVVAEMGRKLGLQSFAEMAQALNHNITAADLSDQLRSLGLSESALRSSPFQRLLAALPPLQEAVGASSERERLEAAQAAGQPSTDAALRRFARLLNADAPSFQDRVEQARLARDAVNAPTDNALAGLKVTYAAGASRQRVEDFGERIPNARKHRYETYSLEEIVSIDDDTMRSFARTGSGGATRMKIWPNIDLEASVASGMSARQALALYDIQQSFASTYASIVALGRKGRHYAHPEFYDSPFGVRLYMAGIANARNLCESDELAKIMNHPTSQWKHKDWTDLAARWFVQPVVEQVLLPALQEHGRFLEPDPRSTAKLTEWVEALYAKPDRHFQTFLFQIPDTLRRLAGRTEEDAAQRIYLKGVDAESRRRRRQSMQEATPDEPRDEDLSDAMGELPAEGDSAAPESATAPDLAQHLIHVERSGLPDWRHGEHVDPDVLLDRFAFRGGQFGHWVPNKERPTWVDMTADALEDFAQELDLPPALMGLGGMLGIAWGARGSGRHAAHFEPGHNVINLTRKTGAGALAHEWTHGFDHWLSLAANLPSSNTLLPFASQDVQSGRIPAVQPQERYAPYAEPLQQVLRDLSDLFYRIRTTQYNLEDPQQCARVDARAFASKHGDPTVFFGASRIGHELRCVQFALESNEGKRYEDRMDREATKDQWRAAFNETGLRERITQVAMGYLGDNLPKSGHASLYEFKPDVGTRTAFEQRVFDLLCDACLVFREEVGEVERMDVRRALFDPFKAHSDLASSVAHLAQYVVRNRRYFGQFGIDFHYEAQNEKRMGGKAYWAAPHELLARAMDSFIGLRLQERQASNTFLCRPESWHGLSRLDADLLREPLDAVLRSISALGKALPESLLRTEAQMARREATDESTDVQYREDPALEGPDEALAQSLVSENLPC